MVDRSIGQSTQGLFVQRFVGAEVGRCSNVSPQVWRCQRRFWDQEQGETPAPLLLFQASSRQPLAGEAPRGYTPLQRKESYGRKARDPGGDLSPGPRISVGVFRRSLLRP